MRIRTLLATVTLSACATAAQAQTQAPSAPPALPSGLTIERVEQGVVFAPDARVTEVNGETAALVGGYVGWMTDRTWLLGGGGYWLANQDDDLQMAYGGLVAEWRARGHERVAFGVKGLIGAGRAQLGTTIGEDFGPDMSPPSRLMFGRPVRFAEAGHRGGGSTSLRVPDDTAILVREYFFVVEPEANVMWHFAEWARLNLGVGYRITAGAGPLDDELRGVSASVAVQFGGGKRAP